MVAGAHGVHFANLESQEAMVPPGHMESPADIRVDGAVVSPGSLGPPTRMGHAEANGVVARNDVAGGQRRAPSRCKPLCRWRLWGRRSARISRRGVGCQNAWRRDAALRRRYPWGHRSAWSHRVVGVAAATGVAGGSGPAGVSRVPARHVSPQVVGAARAHGIATAHGVAGKHEAGHASAEEQEVVGADRRTQWRTRKPRARRSRWGSRRMPSTHGGGSRCRCWCGISTGGNASR